MQLQTFLKNVICLQTAFAIAFYPSCQIPVDLFFLITARSSKKNQKPKKSNTKRWEVQEHGSALRNTTKEDQAEKTRNMAAAKGTRVAAGTAASSGWMFKKTNLSKALKVLFLWLPTGRRCGANFAALQQVLA